jgi:hypothetical protein
MNGIGSKSLGYLDDELAILIRLALRVAEIMGLVSKLDEWCISISKVFSVSHAHQCLLPDGLLTHR